MSVIIVCGGSVAVRRHVMRCPVCERKRRVVSHWSASPYYAPSFTCCACGDSWSDGWLAERPFRRGWRREAIEAAKAAWAAAVAGWPARDAELYVIPDGTTEDREEGSDG